MNNYNRKSTYLPFRLCLILFLFMILFVSCSDKRNNENDGKPNIILIFTDQQNAGTLSAAGNPHLKTPAMDRLAKQGVLFTQTYCTSPVCGPSRSSIVTGRMPHETGVEWNGQSISEGIPTSGEIFKNAGYHTVWAGKWHLPESYPQRAAAKQKTINGFDVLPFWNAEQPRWFLGAETDPPLTTAVVNFLKNYDRKQPLFLAVSYHNPHDICMYPRKAGWVTETDSLLEIRHYGFKHKLPDVVGTHPGKIKNLPPLPDNFEIEKDEPIFLTEKRKNHDEYGLETKLANQEFGDLEWQGYLNAYYRLTEMVDHEIGKVLDALQENGYMENTLIIFTSDHGDGAAAHHWAAKLSLYEESAKVPLIVSWPGKIHEGKTDSNHLVSLTDILPTMLDYANIETGLSFTGESLKPLLEGKTNPWRNYTVVELADYQKDPSRKGRMVRTGPYKYNIYSTGEEQLFHIANDPGETQNLANEPALEKTKIQCRKYLKQWAEATVDSFAVEMLK